MKNIQLTCAHALVKFLIAQKIGIDNYVVALSKRFKVGEVVFDGWKNLVIQQVKDRLSNISTNDDSNGNFINTDVAFAELKEVQKNYVFVPTDKSANNISIVCKKFYLSCIQNELDSTFSEVNVGKDDIINQLKSGLKSFGIRLDEGREDLSTFYGTCKQHKNPTKFRYITSTTCAVLKPLARILKGAFKAIQHEVVRSCNMRVTEPASTS